MPVHRRCRVRSAIAVSASLALFVIWGCAPHRKAPRSNPPPEVRTETRGKTVVLPFVDMTKIFGQSASVRNPLTSKVFFTGQVDEEGAGKMTNALYRMIGPEKGLVWGSYPDGSIDPEIKAGGLKNNFMAQLQSIGRRKKADTVLAGYLYAFRDRTGGSYGVERPAHVAFELVLIGVGSGRILWQRSFQETQKPLSEDITRLGTFLKRGGRWISASEMGANALQEMLKSIPSPRRP
jgi:hypothetical protein